MKCVHQVQDHKYNDNMQCFQLLNLCAINDKICKGSEGICSNFEPAELSEEEKEETMPEEQEKPEEPEEQTAEEAEEQADEEAAEIAEEEAKNKEPEKPES